MPLIPEAGGTERITSLVANGLRKNGHNCMDILVFDESDHKMTYRNKPVQDLYLFLKNHRVDIVINQIAYSTWLIDTFLSKGGERWHAEGGKIVSCLHFDPCNPSFKRLLLSKQKLSFNDCLQLITHTVFSTYYAHIKKKQEGAIYNEIYDRSDAFIILSDTHRPYLKKVMRRSEYNRIFSINNPLTFDRIATTESLDKKNKTILVCARMSEYHKRISLTLKTWKILQRQNAVDGWRLKLVGEGPDLERYKKYVSDNGIGNIEFLGRRNPLPFYEESSILLLTSGAEGWGLSLTEALQNGVVPVVMNSSPVYADIIENGYNGYLCPNGNVKAFARRIAALVENPLQIRTMQKNALASAKKFSIDKTISLWETLITK